MIGLIRDTYMNSCAAMNGISQTIVDRANELASLSARGENLVAACATLSAEETETLAEAVGLSRFQGSVEG
jgi:DNA mismatch repair protein MSH5